MDPGIGLVVLGSVIGSKQLVQRVLGPTADYLGDGLKDWAQSRIENTARIFHKASEKLGEKINEPGTVPPKVLKEVLQEGSYCDDELAAEYFGGVMASSRSGISRDDRGASYLKIVGDLSTYQLRFHYVVYSTWRSMFVGSGYRPSVVEDLKKMCSFFPERTLANSMSFDRGEPVLKILEHCVTGLHQRNLLGAGHYASDKEDVNRLNRNLGWVEVTEGGICVWPTMYGIDLWQWGIGVGPIGIQQYLDPSVVLPKLPNVPLPSGVVKLIRDNASAERPA